MLAVPGLGKNKTVPAKFNLLCEGQKGHNTGQKGHFRDKRDKTRSFRTKRQKGHLFGSVFFPEGAWRWNTHLFVPKMSFFFQGCGPTHHRESPLSAISKIH